MGKVRRHVDDQLEPSVLHGYLEIDQELLHQLCHVHGHVVRFLRLRLQDGGQILYDLGEHLGASRDNSDGLVLVGLQIAQFAIDQKLGVGLDQAQRRA